MWKKFADKEGEAVESFKDAFNDAKTIIQSEFENLMGPEIMKIYKEWLEKPTIYRTSDTENPFCVNKKAARRKRYKRM